MNRIELEEAGIFEIFYDGPEMDLYSVARFQFSLGQLFEKVALKTLLDNEYSRNLLALEFDTTFVQSIGSRRFGYRNLPTVYGPLSSIRPLTVTEELMSIEPVVSMQVKRVRIGSWHQELALAIVPFLAHAEVRAILSGVASNFTYALIRSGIENVVKTPDISDRRSDDEGHDPYDVGENLSEIIRALIDSGRSDARSLTITHKNGDTTSEVTVKLRN